MHSAQRPCCINWGSGEVLHCNKESTGPLLALHTGLGEGRHLLSHECPAKSRKKWLGSEDHKEIMLYASVNISYFPSPHTFSIILFVEMAASLSSSWRESRARHGKSNGSDPQLKKMGCRERRKVKVTVEYRLKMGLSDNLILRGYQQIQNFTWTLPIFQGDK